MDLTGLLGFNVLVGIGTLALITVGLGVIYGMMKIINLAHGEFMMLGAYATYVVDDAWHRHLDCDARHLAALRGSRRPDRRADADPLPLWPHARHDARHLGA